MSEQARSAATGRFQAREQTSMDRFWGVLRIAFGLTFLWAFIDKLFGLGFATTRANSWLNGGSPTNGFLSFATQGPLASAFQSIAGHPVTDTLFMLGLIGVGLSLTLGVAVRVGAYSGMAMLLLMWLAVLPPANHPFLDDHVIYSVALWGVQKTRATHAWSLERNWTRLAFVKAHPSLQ